MKEKKSAAWSLRFGSFVGIKQNRSRPHLNTTYEGGIIMKIAVHYGDVSGTVNGSPVLSFIVRKCTTLHKDIVGKLSKSECSTRLGQAVIAAISMW